MIEFPQAYVATVRGVENVVCIESDGGVIHALVEDDFGNKYRWSPFTRVRDLKPLRLVDPSREVVLDPDDTLEFGAALNGSWLSHEMGYVSEERLSEALRSLLPKPEYEVYGPGQFVKSRSGGSEWFILDTNTEIPRIARVRDGVVVALDGPVTSEHYELLKSLKDMEGAE